MVILVWVETLHLFGPLALALRGVIVIVVIIMQISTEKVNNVVLHCSKLVN